MLSKFRVINGITFVEICVTIYACAQRARVYELDIISVITYSTNTCKYVIKFDENHNKSSDYNQVSFISEI